MKTSIEGAALAAVAALCLVPFACSLDASGIAGAAAGASSSGASSGGGAKGASSSGAGGAGSAPGTSPSSTSSSAASSSGSGVGAGGHVSDGGVDGVSCADILNMNHQAPSGVYKLDPDGPKGMPPFDAYCEMVDKGGGWTLVLKIDGNKSTFEYDASIWDDSTPFQPDKPDLDTNEAKLPSFGTVSLTAMRLGMIDGGVTRWIAVTLNNKQKSLSALVTSGNFTATNATKGTWEQLVASPSLQQNCPTEGFNVNTGHIAKVRLGIEANNENDCDTPDSLIGFGADNSHGGPSGNHACCSSDQGDRNTRTFGYVMVR
jgi:hypothetical protein